MARNYNSNTPNTFGTNPSADFSNPNPPPYPPYQNQQQQFSYQNQGINPNNNFGGPPKKSKAWIGILIGIIVLLLCVGGILFIMRLMPDHGYSNRDKVIDMLITSVNKEDEDTFRNCFPDEKFLTDDSNDMLDNLYETFIDSDIEFDEDSVKIIDETKVSESEMKSKYNIRAKDAVTQRVSISFTQTVMGVDYRVSEEFDITTGKYFKKWFVFEFVSYQDTVTLEDDMPIYTTEADDTTETETTTEESTTATTEQPNTLNFADITTGNVSINGKSYTLPFKYNQISDDYTFDINDYDLTDYGNSGSDNSDKNVLEPDATLSGIYLTSVAHPDSFLYFGINLCNPTSSEIGVYDGYIYGFDIDIDDKYVTDPDLIVAGGGTWGMTEAQICNLYGNPEEDNVYRSDSSDYVTYTYYETDADGINYTLTFTFMNDSVSSISYRMY